MCQCFVRISFKFGNARLYVTDKGVHCLSRRFCWWSSCFRSSWSTFWICCMTVSFWYLLLTDCSNKFSRVTVIFLECWEYSSNSKYLAVGNNFFNECECSNFALRKFCIFIFIFIYNNSWIASCTKNSARCPLASEQSSIMRNVIQWKTTSTSFINTQSFMSLLDNYQLKIVTNVQITIYWYQIRMTSIQEDTQVPVTHVWRPTSYVCDVLRCPTYYFLRPTMSYVCDGDLGVLLDWRHSYLIPLYCNLYVGSNFQLMIV